MSQRPRLSGRRAMALWFAAATAAHVASPLLIARRGQRLGWMAGRPGRLNLLGLVPLTLGSIGLVWCYISHRSAAEDDAVSVSLIPEHLVMTGPYRFSRNPMYVAEQSMWLGWALLFGNRRVLAAAAVLATGMRVAVSREERTLQTQFGDSWDDYKSGAPRWLWPIR
jgi:protein-S-isoprenylcysteine O-methyltransferase Ste14